MTTAKYASLTLKNKAKMRLNILAALNDPNIDFFLLRLLNLIFEEANFQARKNANNTKWFSSSCFRLPRTPYVMDAMHRQGRRM